MLHLLNRFIPFKYISNPPTRLRMTTIRLRIFLVFLPLFFGFSVFAQLNDECSTAILISQPENFCSAIGAGTTVGATASNLPSSACFGTNNEDVWFSFVAVASEVTVIIRGLTFDTPGGTLLLPAVSLYSGSCNTLTELACQSDLFFTNIVELSSSGLTPGETYYFRVQGAAAGTFQYCIRNYFFNGTLSGDCPTAVILCDKSPFTVQALNGAGNDPTELDDAPCLNGFGAETNSTWYVFTAANNGTLEFILTPNNATDDLDFVLYRLPNGLGDCAGKSVVRCMASGDVFFPSPCMGPTGLNSSSTDISEPAGCGPGQDNFLAALHMVAGTTYALAVNNFTSSGNGFQIAWGGTGQFEGPKAGFISNKADSRLCLGDSIVFTDTSTVLGGTIAAWHWNFGVDAQPDTANTPGPHTVHYATAGSKIVSLRVESSTGCEVTVTRTFVVDTCCGVSAGFVSNNADSTVCLGKAVVFTDTSTTTNGTITTWHWNFGAGAQPDTANTAGPHTVEYATAGSKIISLRVESSTGCDVTVTRTLTVDTCCVVTTGFVSNNADSTVCIGKAVVFTDTSGTNNGTITGWHWDFGAGAQPDTANTKGPHTVHYATAGNKIISLQVETSIGCDKMVTRMLGVDTCCAVSAAVVFPTDCADPCPTATVVTTGALLPVTYQWSSGQTDSLATDLVPGNYIITATDALGCTDTVSFRIEEKQQFDIPNAFTPNGDNMNDVFFPVGSGFEVLELAVYSRWGQKVWSGTSGGWDGRLNGKDLPADVYVYRGRVRFKGVVSEPKGEVTLLR